MKKQTTVISIITIAVIFALVPLGYRIGLLEYRDKMQGGLVDMLIGLADWIGISPAWLLVAFFSFLLFLDRRNLLVSKWKICFKKEVSGLDRMLFFFKIAFTLVSLYGALVCRNFK